MSTPRSECLRIYALRWLDAALAHLLGGEADYDAMRQEFNAGNSSLEVQQGKRALIEKSQRTYQLALDVVCRVRQRRLLKRQAAILRSPRFSGITPDCLRQKKSVAFSELPESATLFPKRPRYCLLGECVTSSFFCSLTSTG